MRFMIQKRLLGGATSGIVIVLLVLISSGFSLIQYTPATSWRSQGGIMMSQAGFANELYVNIQPATPIANYQIRLNLNATFNYAACQADGRDIRFFDGINVLSFWTEQWNVAGNSIIWIRIPIASTTRNTMAYGKATIGSASNGNATFPLFDDFSGSSFNVSKWTVENDAYSTTSVSGGLAQLHSLPPSPTRMITFLGFSDLNVIHGSNSPNATTYNNAVDKENEYENALNAGIPTSLSTGIIDSWTVLDYAWTNTSLARFSENDTSIFTATTNVPSMALPVVFAARGISYGLGTHYAAIIRSKTTFGPGHEIRALAYYQYDGRLTYPCLEAYVHVAWVAVRNITAVESVATLSSIVANLSSYVPRNQDFAEKNQITITPSTPLADYVVRLNLDSSFNYAACQPLGQDIRFFSLTNDTLHFWIEKWNENGTSIIWIRIPIAGTTRITMAYGNATIGSGSNGNATFPLFDDFSGSSFNTSKWTVENDVYCTTSVSGGLARLHTLPPNPTRMITFLGFSDLSVIHGSNSPNATTYNNAVDKENEYENALNAGIPTSLSTGIIDSWTVLDYAWTNTSIARFSENDTSIFTATTNVPSMALPVVFAARGISYGLGTHYAAIIRSKTTFGPGHEIRALAYYQYDGRLTYPCLEAYVHVAWVAVRNITAVESVATLSSIVANLSSYVPRNQDFAEKNQITITPSTPLADYVVRLNLDSSFNYAACQPLGQDIRFFSLTNDTLHFWIEKWNENGTSIIWIRIPIAGTTRITMAYGNATIGSGSNGNATFPLFDDFSGSSFNTSKWTVENG